jgi:hypothetical protein
VRAVHISSYNPDGYSRPTFVDALQRAKHVGATHVVLHPTLVASGTTASEVEPKQDSPTLDDLAAGLETVAREGLSAVVAPALEVEGNYPGAYDPEDPAAFFDAYADHVERIADIAGDHDVAAFIAGSMLSLLDGPEHTASWKAILDEVRARCSCQVSYSAENVEGAERVEFWDAADVIAYTSLAALTDEPSTDPDVLTAAWAPVKGRLEALGRKFGKPVVIAELGYQSREDQAAAPAYGASGEPSEEAQAALFEAAFRAFAGAPWFGGIAWYELNGDGAEPEPDDYGFAGKLAEEVLRAWHTAGTR